MFQSVEKQLPPPDTVGYQDRVLMAEIGDLNKQLSQYLLRYLDAEAERAKPVSLAEERALAEGMVALASKMFERASRRAPASTSPVAIEGEATLRGITTGRPSER
jgi:hypothetical protein